MAGYFLRMFGISLGLTLLIEVSFFSAFDLRQKRGLFRSSCEEERDLSEDAGFRPLIVVFLVNVLTNPAAVFLCYVVQNVLPRSFYYPLQILIEILVVLTEGLIYRSFRGETRSFRRPFLLSLILNILSYGTGLVLVACGIL